MDVKLEKASAAMCEDEIVGYLAGRYHTTPQAIVNSYLLREGLVTPEEVERANFILEANEMQIMRDLIEIASR